jgi:uncharacterized FAD-dependent dehydrogenase
MKTVAIVGGGPASLVCAHQLMNVADVTIFERGDDLIQRAKTKSLTEGLGGAGSYSDGKFTLSPKVGISQTLYDILGNVQIKQLMSQIDDFYVQFGAPHDENNPEKYVKTADYSEGFKNRCRQAGFSLIDKTAVRHWGSDFAFNVVENIVKEISGKVEIICNVELLPKFEYKNGKIQLDLPGFSLKPYDYLILAVGRSGASWLKDFYDNTNLPFIPGITDVGVRIECDQSVFEEFYTNYSFEPKLSKTSAFGERVRSFCSCLREGHVVLEEYKHIVDPHGNPLYCVNGHSYSEDAKEITVTGNSNMAVLVSCKFTEPFRDALGYSQSIGSLINTLSNGGVLLQAYKDFKRQRRSTDKRIVESGIVPSLKEGWIAGDLSFCIPYRTMRAIEEFVDGLEILFPGASNCLMYGAEMKLYSNEAKIDTKTFNYIGHDNIYCIGDGSGLTRALSMASIHGLIVSEKIREKIR